MTAIKHIVNRQMAFSRATFGPGLRTAELVEEIREKLEKVEDNPEKWVDILVLALDGLWRSWEGRVLWNKISPHIEYLISTKQGINEQYARKEEF